MSDVESDPKEQEGADESQVSPISDDEVTSSISPDLSDAQIDALTPIVERLVQKHTDQQYSSLKKEVDVLGQLDRYQKLTSEGRLTHEAAKDQIKLEDDIAWLKRQRGESVGSELTEEPAPERASSINYDDAYKKIGIPSPATVEELEWAVTHKTQASLENALLARKVKLPIKKEAPPSTVVSPSGGKTPTEIDEAALNAEFISLTGKPMDMILDSGGTVRERRAEIAKLVG